MEFMRFSQTSYSINYIKAISTCHERFSKQKMSLFCFRSGSVAEAYHGSAEEDRPLHSRKYAGDYGEHSQLPSAPVVLLKNNSGMAH